MSTVISKTTITFTVLHRTDEPIVGFPGDGPLCSPLGEALARSWDGHAVGAETSMTTVEVADDKVEDELIALGNDGEFFDDDLEEL